MGLTKPTNSMAGDLGGPGGPGAVGSIRLCHTIYSFLPPQSLRFRIPFHCIRKRRFRGLHKCALRSASVRTSSALLAPTTAIEKRAALSKLRHMRRHVGPDASPLRRGIVAGRIGMSGFTPPVMPPRTAPHFAAHAV